MHTLLAAPLGLAAALAGSLTDASVEAAQSPRPEATAPAVESVVTVLAPEVAPPDLLAPEVMEATARLQASDPAKICDDKCQVVALTEATLPGTGAADILSVVLEPQEHGLSIPNSDGTPALTIRLVPSKITRGEGLVATAKF